MATFGGLQQTQGNGSATNAGATTSIIAAQGAGKVLRLLECSVSVYLAATGGGGLIRICDGTTTIMQWDANAVMSATADFSPAGYPLTANTALQLIVSGAVTNQASAYCVATALVA